MPLYVIATPIGNPADCSPRAQVLLGEVDLLLCEDTRVTDNLLKRLGIVSPKRVSCHADNEKGRTSMVLAALERGDKVGLVSDAGTPGVSDPGGRIVEAALDAGFVVHPIPGPSALAAAVSISGLPASPLHFLGFPPRKGRQGYIDRAQKLEGTVVFYEAGRRVGDLLETWSTVDPHRVVVVCRELTKTHEEIQRGTLREVDHGPRRGEVVVVLGPRTVVPTASTDVGEGSLKEIAGALARRWGVARKEAYEALLRLERER